MIELIEQHRQQIVEICCRHGVRRLDLFGSAARNDFDAMESDVDFLYEFNDDLSNLSNRFFGLLEDLERLLGRPVDLVSNQDIQNSYFLKVTNKDRVTLYAA
jgi:predicted nucleotidyltransferase